MAKILITGGAGFIGSNIVEELLKSGVKFIRVLDNLKTGKMKNINFLEKIEVKKIYPDTIIINVFETKPIGILFKNNTKYILDSSSNLVLFKKKMLNDFFPGIFGEDAEKEFVNFFNLLKDNQFPWKEIKNYYYFQIGRWDLQLFNNQTIKLPPNKTADAIQHAIELLNHKDFDNYNIIDLRISGKIVAE